MEKFIVKEETHKYGIKTHELTRKELEQKAINRLDNIGWEDEVNHEKVESEEDVRALSSDDLLKYLFDDCQKFTYEVIND